MSRSSSSRGRREQDHSGCNPVIWRKMYIDDLKSAKELDGKTVWMQAGYQLDYYPYREHSAIFREKKGPLPTAQELSVVDVVETSHTRKFGEQNPPRLEEHLRHLCKRGDPREYAVPMGEVEGGDETFRLDDLLLTTTTRTSYIATGRVMYGEAIDQHQVKPGMERDANHDGGRPGSPIGLQQLWQSDRDLHRG